MTRRYAIYFAPPEGSALEAFGRRWLGRDHVTGEAVEPMAIDGLSADEQRRLTRSARHYGFHATLKAPFVLKDGCRLGDLHDAAGAFAAERSAFEAPPLVISSLSRWTAFVLSAASPEMDRLAADCVRAFEPFRAPLNEADIAKRRRSALTPRQDRHMLTYGYPFVFEDFRFHMTLAGPLEPDRQRGLVERLRPHASAIATTPLGVDAISLYQQPDRDTPFLQTARFPFGR